MDKINILKYKNIDINKIQINDFNIKYDNLDFYIQSPIFYNYDIINHQNKKYLELKIDRNKLKHIKFLTLFDTLELKINNQNNIKIKTQIITDIPEKLLIYIIIKYYFFFI